MTWDCGEARERWDDYRIANLGRDDALAFEEHLESCPECARYVDLLEAVETGVADTRMDPLMRRRISVAVARDLDVDGRRKRSRRAMIFAPVGAALFGAAAVVAIVVTGGDPGRPPVKEEARKPATAERLAEASDTGPREDRGRDRVDEIERDGRRVLKVARGVDVWLSMDADATAFMEGLEGKVLLSSGSAVAVIGDHDPGIALSVSTPGGSLVRATGTVFSVEVTSGSSFARVLEGTVAVSLPGGPGGPILLSQGDAMALDSSGGEAVRAAMGDLERDRCVAFGCEPPAGVKSDAPGLEISASTGPDPFRDRDARSAMEAIADQRLDEAGTLVDRVARSDPGSTGTRNLLSRLARAYRRARMFDQAAVTYRRLIEGFPGSESAASGLVALAQIEMDALAQPGEALRHFNGYLETAPSGVLAEAARAGKVRVLFGMGRYSEAAQAVIEYEEKHPAGSSAAQMARLRADSLERLKKPSSTEDIR